MKKDTTPLIVIPRSSGAYSLGIPFTIYENESIDVGFYADSEAKDMSTKRISINKLGFFPDIEGSST